MGQPEFRSLQNYVFGSTAAIITNTSLVVGLGSAQAGKGPILGSLLTIALADNISDSLGIHMYKEAEGSGARLSMLATVLNFLSRLVVSSSFIVIILVFSTAQAIVAAIVWGLLLLVLTSYMITRRSGQNSLLEVLKHVLVAVAVVGLSRYMGYVVARYFH